MEAMGLIHSARIYYFGSDIWSSCMSGTIAALTEFIIRGFGVVVQHWLPGRGNLHAGGVTSWVVGLGQH